MLNAMKRPSFKTVDEYISSFPPGIQAVLENLRSNIKKTVPAAEEVISYQMPAFKWNGVLVWYAAYKEHIGLYPTASPMRVFREELSKFETSKGAIRFPLGKPIPITLVRKIIKFRVRENLEKTKAREKKNAGRKKTAGR